MSGLPFFSQVLTSSRAAGSSFASYTTAKSVINPTELITIPANYLTVGSKFRVRALLGISNVVTAQPTFTFQLMMGSVVAFTTGAVTTNATANTALPASFEAELRVDSIGSGTAAKFMGRATLICAAFASGSTALTLPTTTPAVGTGFDSTVANIFDFWVGLQTSNAGNAVIVYDYLVEQLQGGS